MNVNVVDDLVDVGVEQSVDREGRSLDLRSRQALELVFGGSVHDADLDGAGLFVGLEDRVVLGELREAIAPLDAVAQRGVDAGRIDVLGELGRARPAHEAAGNLRHDNGHEQHDEHDDRRACHRLANV